MEEMKNHLEAIKKMNTVDVFLPGNIDLVLEKIKEESRAVTLDVSTKSGRDEIASLAYKVSRSKTFLDDLGKKLGEDHKKALDSINAERKKVRDDLDDLRDEIRKPLNDWEQAEETRVQGHLKEIASIKKIGAEADSNWMQIGSGDLKNSLQVLMETQRSWEEFEADAKDAIELTVGRLKTAIDKAAAYEQEQEELKKLREEAAQRAQKERDEVIAREAAEKAKREAEMAAQQEALRVARETQLAKDRDEAEKKRIEQEKIRAEERAKAAEHARIAAEKRAEEAALKAEEDKKAAVEAEKERLRREQVLAEAKLKAEAEKREANKRHVAKINNEAAKAFLSGLNIDESLAKEIVIRIAKGMIPNVSIKY